CMSGTRTSLLEDIKEWAMNPASSRAYLLHGTAGKGKSAIAHTAAMLLEKAGAITPFCAFDRSDAIGRSARHLFPTLAYQLGRRNPLYSQWLCDLPVVDLASLDLVEQAKNLFINGLRNDTVATPVIFVIDALDECPHAGIRAAVDRSSLLDQLGDLLASTRLPPDVRFLVTYRPEDDIV
ncbi:hypothetical protein EV714DRAFT_188233, partial [Schizophyllum commune]